MKKFTKTVVAALGTVVSFVIAVAGDDNIQFDGGEQGMVATFAAATLGVFLARNKGKDLNTNGSVATGSEARQGGPTLHDGSTVVAPGGNGIL